ncbi:hypothetical protein O0L34_g3093 [Tuta absoluta]|nr:hypothetical protein O0L34_g3093 [Tuta absoluta]
MVCHNKLIIKDADNSQTTPLLEYQRSFCLSGIQRTRISLNWARGIYRSKVILYHQTKYMPWTKLYKSDSLLLSVGSDLHCYPIEHKKSRGYPVCKKMRWKLEAPFVPRNDIRTNDISRFIIKDGIIVCGNRDGCVSVYKMDDVAQKPKLIHHIEDCHENGKVEVTAVELINSNHLKYVVTASSACSNLCFWCLTADSSDSIHKNISCMERVKCTSEVGLGEGIGIRCLDVHSTENKLAIGLDGSSKPRLLDVNTGQLLLNTETIVNSKHAVRDIGWHDNNTMMYVTHSGILQFLDIRSGNVVYNIMDPFQSSLYCVKSDHHNAVIVGSSEYCRCVLFDTRKSSRHVQLYFTQRRSSPIYSLDFDPLKLIAAADQSVALLNFGIRSDTSVPQDYSQPFEFVTR